MNRFKLIVFDLDGTLINSYPAIISSMNYTLEKLGYAKQSNTKIKRAVGWGDMALLSLFFEKKDLKKAIKIYRNHHKKSLINESSFTPYAKSLLSYLYNRGYKLAVASNRPAKFSEILIKHLGIKKFFDYVLCKDQIRFGKPHPSILNKILESLNVKKKEALYVGDMVIDILTAKRAKVKVFAVATGSNTFDELRQKRPDYLSRDLTKLFKIL